MGPEVFAEFDSIFQLTDSEKIARMPAALHETI